MNERRVAALLRELADALEAPAEPKRPRRLNVAPPEKAPSPEARALVQRTLRRKGLARG
jgi:hypothetical protein